MCIHQTVGWKPRESKAIQRPCQETKQMRLDTGKSVHCSIARRRKERKGTLEISLEPTHVESIQFMPHNAYFGHTYFLKSFETMCLAFFTLANCFLQAKLKTVYIFLVCVFFLHFLPLTVSLCISLSWRSTLISI